MPRKTNMEDLMYRFGVKKEKKMTKLRCNYKPRGYWTKEQVIKEARKHSMIKKWRFAEPSSYSIACQKGWLDEASQHMKRNNCSYNNGNTQ